MKKKIFRERNLQKEVKVVFEEPIETRVKKLQEVLNENLEVPVEPKKRGRRKSVKSDK